MGLLAARLACLAGHGLGWLAGHAWAWLAAPLAGWPLPGHGWPAPGHGSSAHLDAARRLIGSMPVAPDAYTYTPLIRVLCDRGRVADALSLLDDMLRRRCQPNIVTYTVLLEAMCRNSGFAQAMAVLDKMRAKGCTPNIVTSSSMACAGKAVLMTQGSS